MAKPTVGERYLDRVSRQRREALDEFQREAEEGERPARALLELVEMGVDPWEFHDVIFLAWKTRDVFLAAAASTYLEREGLSSKVLPVISQVSGEASWVVQVSGPMRLLKAPRLG